MRNYAKYLIIAILASAFQACGNSSDDTQETASPTKSKFLENYHTPKVKK